MQSSLLLHNQKIVETLNNSNEPHNDVKKFFNPIQGLEFLHQIDKSVYTKEFLNSLKEWSRISASDLPVFVLTNKELMDNNYYLTWLNDDNKKMYFLSEMPIEITKDTELIIRIYENFDNPPLVTTNPFVHFKAMKNLKNNEFFQKSFKKNIPFSMESIFDKDTTLNSLLNMAPNIVDTILRDMTVFYDQDLMKKDVNNFSIKKHKVLKF